MTAASGIQRHERLPHQPSTVGAQVTAQRAHHGGARNRVGTEGTIGTIGRT